MADVYKFGSRKLQEHLHNLNNAYVKFILKHPEICEHMEKTINAATFILEMSTANCETSIFMTEFVTAMCKLFTYANSYILMKFRRGFSRGKDIVVVEEIKQILSVMEFLQAFFEILAYKIGGPAARWAVIALICLVKAVLRCILIFFFETGIQSPSNNNVTKMSNFSFSSSKKNKSNADEEPEVIYIGADAGSKRKTLHSLSSNSKWSPSRNITRFPFLHLPSSSLNETEKIGECLHAVRPLVHVLLCGAFGTKCIFPWLVALVMDSSSHVLLQRTSKLPTSPTSTIRPLYTDKEISELRLRYAKLFLYLLRSPIYDVYAESVLLGILNVLSNNVPFGKYLFRPLLKYIPAWQKVYFYNWAD